MLEGPSPRRQSSGSGSRLGLRRSTSVISSRMAPMQLEQLLTGNHLLAESVNFGPILVMQRKRTLNPEQANLDSLVPSSSHGIVAHVAVCR